MSNKNELAVLTEREKRLAEALALRSLESNKRTLIEIANEHGITDRQLYTYRQKPEFVAYMNEVSSMVTRAVTSEVVDRLIEHIRDDHKSTSLKAIKMFLEMQGMLQGNNTTNVIIEQPNKATLIDDIEELERRIKKARGEEPIEAEFEEIENEE
ncbi:phBC6A51 family helix-turn-helix protein [Bacillus sp. FSL M7-0417]|uniref:phBC6A51 family helix-turn-helix protein n=1 Tax=Bacillus sp. FSL M7-0417 TaxID=2921532 RepID=UPI002E201C54|nr:phBC6A51 family helix-turn-helix protein [Bacillus subtilis]